MLSKDEQKILQLADLNYFAPNFLKIRNKAGSIKALDFNKAQTHLHDKLNDQLKKNGKVRAIVLKGRQQGSSTYIQGRYFHKVITQIGKKAFILTHEADATKNLFEMTKRYYEKLPDGLCPVADRASAKELRFVQFDSGYAVGTAGNKGVGRSQTIQLFHGSEVAFWPNAEEHAKGVLQSVSNESGTEIILESTANGIGNYFHNMWMAAIKRESEYIAIFLPWYWQNEYTESDAGLNLTEEEKELLDIYGEDGLTTRHIAWRRIKISGFSSDYDAGLELFKQEYPFTAEEAFRNPIGNIFINSSAVMRARKADVYSEAGLIIGVDVAISDNDKTAIVRRKGRVAYSLETHRNYNTMEIAGLLKRIITNEKPVKVYIDCIGIGAGVVDRLREMGFNQVEGINVARSADDKEKYRNKRAELWAEMKDWLNNEMPIQIPDDDELHGDLCSLGYRFNSNGQLQIESKDELRARGMKSPDTADALALTFSCGQYEAHLISPIPQPKPLKKGMFF
jgi:hypothetical protein